ncbi:MAG: glycosyltransferase 87 family protein [Coleofasciculus sp. A1-SPW-01]|uniref:hypothetical protein n=1 Tax=Coleofasciculus sp. A1-SPW-01 TaxID=3070819 RepID=UPI0032FAD37B
MDNSNKVLLKKLLNIILIVSIFISSFGFIVDIKNTIEYGGVDLRQRVVGARLLLNKIDPYYFKWHLGDSELFLDPQDNKDWDVSRVTVTPTILTFHAIIANFSYQNQKIIWLILQWIFLGGSLAIFVKCESSQIKRKLILIVGLLFISGSYFWRYHVERGQIYVLYIFLLALSYWMAKQSLHYRSLKIDNLLSGFILGISVSFRPPILVATIPMLLYKKWELLLGTAIGIIAGLLSSFILADLSIWKSYSSAMKIHGLIKLGVIKSQLRTDVVYPKIIEGMTNLPDAMNVPKLTTSLMYIFNRFFNIKLYPNMLIILLALVFVILCGFIFKYRKLKSSTDLVFLLSSFMVLISEYFIPAYRNSYADVQWIMPLALIIILSEEEFILSNKINVLLVLSLLLSSGFNWVSWGLFIGSFLLVIYATIMTVSIVKKSTNKAIINH